MADETPKSHSPFDDSIWLELFEAAFLDDDSVAEQAAKLWYYLLSQIESGPKGITAARQCLENGIRLTFPFTTTYKTCRSLFELSLAEDFDPENAPLTILKAAMQKMGR